MKKHLLNHIHKPNWFWVENFTEKNETIKNTDFDANTTFYEKWSNVYFVRNQSDVSASALERNIKLNAAITYDEIVNVLHHKVATIVLLYLSVGSSRLFLKTLEEKKSNW